MPKTFKFFKWSGKKAVAVLCISVALTAAIVGTTIAFLKTGTEPLDVGFEPSTVSIVKTADGKGVINNGDVNVYIRAAMVFTWKSTAEENSIMSSAPTEGTDYEFSVASGWVKAADGFWYYLTPVSAGQTCQAISSVTLKKNAPAGYELSAEMLVDAIQSDPMNAVTESWESGVESIDTNGALVLKQNQQ